MAYKLVLIHIALGLFINCNVKSSPQQEMEKQENQQAVKTELPATGLSEKHLNLAPIFRTYDSGTRTQSENAMALYDDGTIYRYSAELISFEDGKMKTTEVPLEWRIESHIKESSVKAIKNLLDEFKPDENHPSDVGDQLEISTHLDGVDHTFHLQGEDSPLNYMIYTKINREISLGTLPKE